MDDTSTDGKSRRNEGIFHYSAIAIQPSATLYHP
jgi:hypothetical protein